MDPGLLDWVLDYNNHAAVSAGAALSVEVFTKEPMEMIRQAEHFVRLFDYPHRNIKVPIGWEELQVINDLRSHFKTFRRVIKAHAR